MNRREDEILKVWDKVNEEKSVWDNLYIKDNCIYFNAPNKKILLSSIKNEDLPRPPYQLTAMGKVLTKLSTFANVMSKRPGTEEVTFYSLINRPQGNFLGSYFDKKILDVVGPPIKWRRREIEKSIKQELKKYIFEYKESFAFIDIGSGGGFDSLEIERIISGMENALGKNVLPKEYDMLNIDIDEKWLNNNEKLCKDIFQNKSRMKRYKMSIFEYLDKRGYVNDFSKQDNLMISCNGFAEFLSEEDLRKLYVGIRDMAKTFSGKINIVLAFATKNKKQEDLGNKIGFKFKAREKEDMINLIEEIFADYKFTYREKYSQIVLTIKG